MSEQQCGNCVYVRSAWGEFGEILVCSFDCASRGGYMHARKVAETDHCEAFIEIPPESLCAASERLRVVLGRLWWEIVKAMRLDRLVGWLADRMRQFAKWWHGRK